MISQHPIQNMAPNFPLRAVSAVVASLFAAWPAVHAQLAPGALPSGASIVSGSASMQAGAAALTVQQHSDKLITNWNQFNIGKDAKVEFIQPSAQAMVLNRVTGGSASQIMGMLKANGRVFLVNPSGIVFGPTARVDVGALTASTLDIRDRDFLDSRLQFDLKNPAGRIQNFGEIIARQGGFVALLGAEVDNAGRIVATGGQAALAAGQTVRMQIGETGLLSMDVSLAQTPTQVSNSGTVIANGGNVLMSAQSAAGLLSGAVNLSGVVQASRIDGQGGNVRLDGGEVTVRSSGRIESLGKGTDVTLWSERSTRMDGVITALQGTVDTSSKGDLGVTGQVNAQSWILDPVDLTVVQTVTDSTKQIAASTIENFLNGGTPVPADATEGAAPNTSTYVDYNTTGGRTLSLLATANVYVDADISKTLNPTPGAATTLILGSQSASGNDTNVIVNKPISSIAGALNIQFGVSALDGGGQATLNAPLATNGGSVTSYKEARLAHATPISTKITEASSGKSGDIVFHKNVLLAAPGYAVSLDTQGPQSGGSYTGRGGNINFMADVLSAKPDSVPQFAQALTLDSTGYDATALNGPGVITLGTTNTNMVGGTNRSVGQVNAIRSLTLLGDMNVQLNASQINIVSSNGNVITAESRLGTPSIVLNAPSTTIDIRGDRFGQLAGNVQGYTDYLQSSFNIAGSNAPSPASPQALIINSDRAIKLVDRSITAGTGGLQVAFNPNQSGGSGVGGVVLNNASVATGGQNFTVSNARGNGADSQLQTDGFYAFNSSVRTLGGALTITAEAPVDEAAGAGIRLVGAQTVLDSRAGALTLAGSVNGFAAAGNKDGVVIGEGGNARVTVASSSGNISITGDASGVGSSDAVTGGDRYNGVVISSKALVQTGSGQITIIGKGGGGNKVFIGENHGVRFSDADTSVVSDSGNIAIMGQSGGKTTATSGANSFGIYADGATMYLGSDAAAYETTGANIGLLKAAGPTATGHITLAADSMQFVNTSSSHLKVASRKPTANDNGGELRIHTLGAGTDIEIGSTTGQVATSQNKATLYLGNNWFNGSTNAIFQPGFRDVVIGNALASNLPAAGEAASVGSTGTLTVSSAATFRDNLVLDMNGTGGKANIAANLTVVRAGSDDRTLTIRTQAGAQAAGIVRVDALQLLGSGDQVFSGGNLVNTLAANVDGHVLLNNAQNLQVGTVSVFGGDVADPASHAGKNKWLDLAGNTQVGAPTQGVTALNRNVTLNVTNGNLDQTSVGAIRAASLSARATGWVDLFKAAANDVDNLAGQASGGDFAWKDADGFKVTQVVNTLGSVVDTLTGVTATGTIDLQALTGDITQDQRIQANALRARAGGSVVLKHDSNNVVTVSGVAGQDWAYTDADNVQVANTGASLSDAATAGVSANLTNGTIDLRSVAGGLSQTISGALRATNLQASAATGVVLDTASDGANPASPTNDVGLIAGSTAAGDFIYRDVNALTVGTAAGTNGITVPAGSVSLQAGAALNQTAAGVIAAPRLRAVAGSVGLNAATNNVQTLAGSAADAGFAFKNAGALTVGQVQADGTRLSSEGIAAHATNGTVNLETLAGALGQTAAGGITGGALRAVAPAGVLLATADGNNVAEIEGAASAGHFAFRDAAGDLNVGLAGSSAGIAASATAGTVDLQVVAGSLTQSQNITGQALRAQAQGSVSLATVANNNVDLLAGAATTGNFSYRDADAVTVATVAFAQDATVKTAGIRTDVASATLDLRAATALDQQAGAPVMAKDGLLRGASVSMKERDNQISTLAGSASNGGFAFYGTADLTVGTVGVQAGIAATAVAGARAEVDVQTRGNLTLRQSVSGQSAGNQLLDEAVVLRAEKRFFNETGLGSLAILATGGRWLVYDHNPLLLGKDMNGLAASRNFLLINTRYQDYPPASVFAKGNGYITTAQALEPADVARPVTGHQSVGQGNHVRQFALGDLPSLVRINGLIGAPAATGASLPLGDTSAGSVGQQTPLRVSVASGQPFRIDLRSLVGQGRLSGVTLADGGAAPWVATDGANAGLIGTAAGAADLAVSIQDPGAGQPRRVRVQLQPR